MPTRTQFVDTLKQALWQERMNPRQLALSIDVSPSLVTRILAGERNPPSDALIAKIAEVLNLDPDKLLMEAGRPPRFLTGFLCATRPITDEDVKVLKQATARLRQRHKASPQEGKR